MTVPGVLSTTRNIWVTTPLPDGTLALERMDGHETLGQPFSYDLSLYSTNFDIDLSTLLGQPMTVHVEMPTGATRHFNGIVTRASHLDGEGNHARYSVTLQPWIWLLDFKSDCRIFQDLSVPDIIKKVFRDANFSDFEDALSSDGYPQLDYCVQYNESDFNFVSRLMEHAGIYYFFRHTEDKHTLVLADSYSAHSSPPGYDEVSYLPEDDAKNRSDDEHLSSWTVVQQIRSGAFAATDYDFTTPRASLLSAVKKPQNYAHADGEVYIYPGDFLTASDGQTLVGRRLEERQYENEVIHAAGDVRGLGAGDLFDLTDFPREDQNREYLVVSALLSLHAGDYDSTSNKGETEVSVSFTLLNSDVQYRPPLRAVKNQAEGPQTAVVVGPSGEEIWTDKYGRVKVQFHWDRDGKDDEDSSCWVRVAQVWAGSGWGGMHIPRIGQEVIVDFLEGDPDRPIITGRVYNADNMPPYALPGNQTQSGIKSHSTKGGGLANFNELRFEDKKGAEEVYVQAEKDLDALVKNDETRSVGHDRTTDIKNDEKITVGDNRTESVAKDESITIGNNRTESVAKAETVSIGTTRTHSVGTDETVSVGGARTASVGKDESISVGANQVVSIGKNLSLDVGGARTLTIGKDDTINVDGKLTVSVAKDEAREVGKTLTINAADSITLVSGDASIVLQKNGNITIKGKDISLNASGKLNLVASSDVTIKGSKVSQN